MQCIRSVDCLPKDCTHRKNVMYTVIPAIQWSKYKIWPIKVEKKAALTHTRAREKSNTATRPEPQTKKQRLQTEPASQPMCNKWNIFQFKRKYLCYKMWSMPFLSTSLTSIEFRCNFEHLPAQTKPIEAKRSQTSGCCNQTEPNQRAKLISFV